MALFQGSDLQIRVKCRLILFYVIFSMLTLFHYRQEPPHSYSNWVNTIIIGESITGLMVTAVVTFIAYLNSKNFFRNTSNSDINSLVQINDNYVNSSDDEEIETYNRNKVQSARHRSRSQTPTKTTAL